MFKGQKKETKSKKAVLLSLLRYFSSCKKHLGPEKALYPTLCSGSCSVENAVLEGDSSSEMANNFTCKRHLNNSDELPRHTRSQQQLLSIMVNLLT